MTISSPDYAPGTPDWVDISSSDIGATSRFYSELFGWQAEDMGEEYGHYTVFRYDGKMVAGGTPLMSPQQPVAWQTYIASSDAVATTKAVRDAGGQVVVDPIAVMQLGIMAVCTDPSGAAFAIWQAVEHKGAELVNRPFSLSWTELSTRDLESAKTFYPKVFGWGVKSNQVPGMGENVEWQIDGRSVAGALTMPNQVPAEVPPNWLVYFAVADTDATVATATALGGKVMAPATDIWQGRIAVLSDPLGGVFAIVKRSDADVRLYGYGPGEGAGGV